MSSIETNAIQCLTLPGGLPLVLRPSSGPEVLAARLVIRGGSGADPDGIREIGRAHV